jgi:hypothetical protein
LVRAAAVVARRSVGRTARRATCRIVRDAQHSESRGCHRPAPYPRGVGAFDEGAPHNACTYAWACVVQALWPSALARNTAASVLIDDDARVVRRGRGRTGIGGGGRRVLRRRRARWPNGAGGSAAAAGREGSIVATVADKFPDCFLGRGVDCAAARQGAKSQHSDDGARKDHHFLRTV